MSISKGGVKLKFLVGMCLLCIQWGVYANAQNISSHELIQNIRVLEAELKDMRVELETQISLDVEKSSYNDSFIFLPSEKKQITKALNTYFVFLYQIHKDEISKNFNYKSSDSSEYFQSLAINALFYSEVASVLNWLFSSPAIVKIFELDMRPSATREWVQELLREVLRQGRSKGEGLNGSVVTTPKVVNRSPSLGTAADNIKQLRRYLKRIKSDELRVFLTSHFNQFFNAFFTESAELKKNISNNYSAGSESDFFYNIKAAILYAAGRVYLPKEYYISRKEIEDIEHDLLPGDIALIRHDKKLVNVAFRGEWSHSILYIGSPEKLSQYYDSDYETKDYFHKLCLQEDRECFDFTSYLESKFPDKMAQYYKGSKYEGQRVPLVALEGKGEGIILSNLYAALMKDQLVVFRAQNMSKKDRALAIAQGFEYMGRPYDYDFDLRTTERLVCTELIFNIFSPDVDNGKSGISWSTSFVNGKPIMFAEDIVKTYFDEANISNSNLSLVVFVHPNRAGREARPLTSDDLRKTVVALASNKH
ncbi:MAG: hypothetical protein KDD38_00690 [Bdellovibrionales bacterium]|nr:hypothetical protein [Bdellovibrionales bacterium]